MPLLLSTVYSYEVNVEELQLCSFLFLIVVSIEMSPVFCSINQNHSQLYQHLLSI